MRLSWCTVLFSAATLLAQPQVPVVNVNSRYAVESIEISGEGELTLSKGLYEEIQRMIGEKLDLSLLNELASRIRVELHAKSVSHKITRGEQPEHVKVVFEIVRRSADLDVSVPRFLYHSKQGWTGEIESVIRYGSSSVGFGLVSDSDELPERNAGIFARYENRRIGTERARLRFQFESYHQQWNNATLLDPRLSGLAGEAAVPGIYRTRQNFQPTATFELAPALTLEVGVSFERMQFQYPAAHNEASNSVVNTLRYHRQWEVSEAHKHSLDAGYALRAATRIFSSDFAYTRHRWSAGYSLRQGNQGLLVHFLGGRITGVAPLFERYVLGNSSTLRGWNKFDVAPLGGSRVAHTSVEYRYRHLKIFYDTGAVWDDGQDPNTRHAAGIGLRADGFSLAVAFPLKKGRAEPILMAGMNF